MIFFRSDLILIGIIKRQTAQRGFAGNTLARIPG